MNPTLTEAFIRDLPKTDLHVHLDGSLRLSTLIDLARAKGVTLPSFTESGLRELVFKDGYRDLAEYLTGFQYTCAVLNDPEALTRVAYEMALDCIDEGVRYFEVRFAPMLHINAHMDMERVLTAVDDGLRRAKAEFNQRLIRDNDPSPPFDYGMIACAMRRFTAAFGPYYKQLCETLRYTPEQTLYAVGSLELARAVVDIRDRTGLPIVGFDLAGEEKGYPAVNHLDAYDYVHRHFMKKTVHAGEAFGAESIFQAITRLHADRIGHGYHLFNRNLISDKVADPDDYIRQLSQYIADSRITLEVCLSSNMNTDPDLTNLADHPFGQMHEHRLSTTICTDNRLITNTTVSRELKLAVDHFDISPRDLKNIIIYGFKRSFFPRPYREKRAYVRQIIDYYSEVERRHQINVEPVT